MRFYIGFGVWFLIFGINTSLAQNDVVPNGHFWGELQIMGKIKNHWEYQVDYSYRRGADDASQPEPRDASLFAHPVQQVLRPWIIYEPSENWRIAFSPLGFWANWSNENQQIFFRPEFRQTLQVIYQHEVKRVNFQYRLRYELRGLGTEIYVPDEFGLFNGDAYKGFYSKGQIGGRLRFQARAVIPLNKKEITTGTVFTQVFDEFMINTSAGRLAQELPDQNRIYVGVGVEIPLKIRLEVGYNQQMQFRYEPAMGGYRIPLNHVLQFMIQFQDFNLLFKRSKKNKN